MPRILLFATLIILVNPLPFLDAEDRGDADGDGISDCHEEVLGTDPAVAERFVPILRDGLEPEDRRQKETYDATKDVLDVEFCHVGDDRYFWRVTFAAEPRLEDTVLHLYVDADADPATGREGPENSSHTGTEYMLTVAAGHGRSSYYDKDGNSTTGPPVNHVVDGKAVLLSADIELGRDAQGIRYDLHVLCHTTTQPGQSARMSDSSGKRPVSGVPVSDRKKRMRPGDYLENFGVAATFGVDRLQAVLYADDTISVPHDRLELQGFSVDLFTSRRWPHVKRDEPNGKVWTTAPRAGRYHVGFVMYDDSRDERVAIFIDGQLCGVAVARQDNNRTWLYWLERPREFRGGERVELRGIGSGGKHGISCILFMPKPPEVRSIEYRTDNMVAATCVDRPGQVILSWTTTWPCPTRFEYGHDQRYGTLVENHTPCLVHRVVLEGLDPKATYHGRPIGTDGAGKRIYGEDFAFRATPPAVPETIGGTHSVKLEVSNPHPFAARRWPVTTGVPFPQGQLGSVDHVRLLHDGAEVPAQLQAMASWPDGSIKCVLATFFADAPAGGHSHYEVEFGREVSGSGGQGGPLVRKDNNDLVVDTGAIRFRIDGHGNLADIQRGETPLLQPGTVCQTEATDMNGRKYDTSGENADITVEQNGSLRVVVKAVSHLKNPDNKELLRIEKRIEAYRGVAWVRIHHTFIVTGPEKFRRLKELSYRVPVMTAGNTWQVPLADGNTLELGEAARTVCQRFDDELINTSGAKETAGKGRVVGAILASSENGGALAVRDFWQNYPKAFTISEKGVDIGLCPSFPDGLYDRFPFEREGHQLFYYLLGGHYRLKQGTSKTHELLLCFEPAERRRELCSLFQRPPLAAVSPQWNCRSKVFYDVAARDPVSFEHYESAIDKNLQAYVARRERQRDFGMLNYGDWYGERGTNWGNVEYDTQHAFFLEFIRSGNPDAFFLGEATQLHNRDIDTVQWSEDPLQIGGVYVHQMCHVGEYYDKSVPGSLGFARGGFTVSHAWVEGHFDHWYLTGDRRSFETGCAVADFFVRKQLGRPYDFSSCRTPGWHLIMLAAAYRATNDPYYLNAARVIVERVLEAQELQPRPLPPHQREGREPYQVGGWSRMMVPGHCHCEPRHRGNAGFMVAVLLSGLKYYHDLTGDDRVKQCIIRGAHYLLDECYSDEVKGFRYTSCPNTPYRPGATPLMAEGIARAYLWTGDKRLGRMLRESLPLSTYGSSYGKGFSMYYRAGPRVLADLQAAENLHGR